MFRYKITIEYDGTGFHGWQSQKNVKTIQGELEAALLKLTQQKVRVYGASRTDAGVHAYGQVAHFDLSKFYETYKVQEAINHYMKPQSICVVKIEQVTEHFHARFSTKTKQYIYKIINRISPSALLKNRVWHIKYQLNIQSMNLAAKHLVGTHDFSSFRARGCQCFSPIKTISDIHINKIQDEIEITFIAKSFLYNQVRIMVGTLCDFGKNKFHHTYMKEIIEAKDRNLAGETAPSCGLYMSKIFYSS